MKIGIISDTHDQTDKCEKAIEILEKETRIVIHCGDFEKPEILKMFQNRKFCFKYVKGNHDNSRIRNQTDGTGPLGEVLKFTIEKRNFGAYHNTYDPGQQHTVVYESISSGKYDYFLYGHLHFFNARFPDQELKTVGINPGGMMPVEIKETSDQMDLSSFAILDLEKREVQVLTYYQWRFLPTLKVLLDWDRIQFDITFKHVQEYLSNLKRYLDSYQKNYRYKWSEGNGDAWLNRRWKNEFRKIGLK